jgi:hypothetical protein
VKLIRIWLNKIEICQDVLPWFARIESIRALVRKIKSKAKGLKSQLCGVEVS